MHAKVLLEPRRGKSSSRIDEKGITDPKVLAEELNRKPEAIRKKLKRMAVVVGQQKITRTTTTEVVPKDLLTHEQALKNLAGAVYQLDAKGLDKMELQRLRILVDAIQAYDSVLDRIFYPQNPKKTHLTMGVITYACMLR